MANHAVDSYPINPDINRTSPSRYYNSPRGAGSIAGSHLSKQVGFSEGPSNGLAFVPPRILNRPLRPPSWKNVETAESQYEEEQRREEIKRANWHQYYQHSRVGTFEIGQDPSNPQDRSATCQHNRYHDFKGTYDPVKGVWLDEEEADRAGHSSARINHTAQPHFQRARTVNSAAHYNSYNPMTSTWTDEAGLHQKELPSGAIALGRTPLKAQGGKARMVPSSMGVWNPITNEWIAPPEDARFLDREASFFH
eukprot:CAMPEP_0118948966 /NCGR_PEP_ID=MMETSP1169-20130426/48770_1 /TAXON_ID=36882 /ORGANISM="Pyramimonas obovata, Strain CCMP722" /LENGTH=251 /DNA_ID=CAMNT_0006895495 /DNA_START=73 /DNA_END=828 /DNA_ORIENTATION=-